MIGTARRNLGLSLAEFANIHRVSTLAIRRWEYPESSDNHRDPSGLSVALNEALLSGSDKAFVDALLGDWRPKGWTHD